MRDNRAGPVTACIAASGAKAIQCAHIALTGDTQATERDGRRWFAITGYELR